MTRTAFVGLFFLASALAGLTSPAGAFSARFYGNTPGTYTGPFNSSAAFTTTNGDPLSVCNSGACTVVGGDIIQSSIAFATTAFDPVVITASANSTNRVWFDMAPPFGGLGVDTSGNGTGDDQIVGSGILHLHFASQVNLTGVATLFDTGHSPFGTGYDPLTVGTKSFLFCATTTTCTPTTEVTFASANNNALSSSGTDFYFAEDLNVLKGLVEFYVSGVTFQAVPGPIAGAGLPGLLLAGAGFLGWWRRKRQALPAAAA